MAQLAIAWTLANTDVSTTLLGFSRTTQVTENLAALAVYEKWTPELEEAASKVFNTKPEYTLDWRTWKTEESRRERKNYHD